MNRRLPAPRPPMPGLTVRCHVLGFSRIVITGKVRQVGHRWWDIAGQRVPVHRVDRWEPAARLPRSA